MKNFFINLLFLVLGIAGTLGYQHYNEPKQDAVVSDSTKVDSVKTDTVKTIVPTTIDSIKK